MKIVLDEDQIISKIIYIRGKKAILDRDLSNLYQIDTRALNQAVKRNINRFPDDFLFHLTESEWNSLRSQNVILDNRRGTHPKYLPYAFTEHGVLMTSNILKSKTAIDVSIQIVRTFVKLRDMVSLNKDLKEKIEHMERKYDQQFRVVFEAVKHIVNPDRSKIKIGFLTDND
ncbi:MAG: ORF6N domain-containing protein [Candidatus Margulisbacteria bacterium]|nr:ORF6N domain-containing protein [Candidatus Margulisiibacteriota bacterium]